MCAAPTVAPVATGGEAVDGYQQNMPSGVDEYSIPLRGSALHIAYYVNCEPDTLNAAVLDRAGGESIGWRSPLAADRFAEYKDRDFLTAVDRPDLAGELTTWWPSSGPRWDGLGVILGTGGVVLIEAKANVSEIANGPACGSGSSGSERGRANRQRIEQSLSVTRAHFGISEAAAAAWIETHCYQYANRLAHLCFLERLDVPARLINVYFTGDTSYISTAAEDFDTQRQADAEAMGIADVSLDSSAVAYLPARREAYAELRALAA